LKFEAMQGFAKLQFTQGTYVL